MTPEGYGRVDDDVPANQPAADDMPGMPGMSLRPGGRVSPFSFSFRASGQ
jgi:hypothetical protein